MQATTFGDIAVTPHHFATATAVRLMANGANAVEAAIAANAVLGVVAPETCGIGGDLFAIVWEPGATAPAALNASGRAGSGADPTLLAGASSIPSDHPLAVTVPGCVDGWHALLDRYGTRPLSDLLAPAISYAEAGFPASTEHARAFTMRSDQLSTQAAGQGIYTDNAPPRTGQRVTRPGLASSLEAAAAGRSDFYLGAPGVAISEAAQGLITEEDRKRSQADWVTPISVDVFGRTGWTVPPNSQGYLTLAAAKVYEGVSRPSSSAERVHVEIEAYRAVAASRSRILAEDGPVPDAALLTPDRLAEVGRTLDRDQAGRWGSWTSLPSGTEYHCVVDREGIAVSFIQSNFHGIGSGIGAGDAGFFLHDRGCGFTLQDGHPNQLAPGRRPAHTLSPSLWTADGRLDAVLGCRGGDAQPQLLLQIASAVFDRSSTPDEGQAAPRWLIRGFDTDSNHVVLLEPGLGGLADELRHRGHPVEVTDGPQGGWGPVSIITVDERGLRTGAPDPRVDTTSVAVL